MYPSSSLARTSATPLRQWWYLGLIVVPIAAFVCMLIVGVWLELRASQQVNVLLHQSEQRAEPSDNQTLARQFDSRTDHTRAVRWQQIADAAISIENLYWVALASEDWDDLGKLVPPNEDWMMAPVLDSFSKDAQPIVAEVREVLASPKPIWQPIIYQDYETLLPGIQSSRSIVRMLAYEVRAAYHAGDHQRVIETLALMPKLADTIDYQNSLIVELVRIAIIGVHRGLIRESLSHDYWRTEEIALLEQQLESTVGREETWRMIIASEAAFARELLGMKDGKSIGRYGGTDMNSLAPFGVVPSHQLLLLETFNQMATYPFNFDSGDTGLVGLMQDEAMKHMHATSSLLAVPLASADTLGGVVWPGFRSYAEAIARTHRDRRWTRCALSIKQFQLTHNLWPKSLDELTQVGLTRSDWMAKPNMPFGYQVAKDDSHVLLWTVALSGQDESIEPVPPSTLEKHANYLEAVETTIR